MESNTFYWAVYDVEETEARSRGKPVEETVRFTAARHMGFSSRDYRVIQSSSGENGKTRIEVDFMGLYGPSSPLPAFYTEDVCGYTDVEKQSVVFLDVFNHRLISSLYKIWQRYDNLNDRNKNAFRNILETICGSSVIDDTDGCGNAMGMVSLYVQGNKTTREVAKILSHTYGFKIDVAERVVKRVNLAEEQQIKLGSHGRIGRNTMLGDSIRDSTSHVDIVVGPMTYTQYESFLQNGDRHRELTHDCVKYMNGISFDIYYLIRRETIKENSLSGSSSMALGKNTWLARKRCGIERIKARNTRNEKL